ncbi:MAG: hypothetical protein EZS28_018370 [Streblomastix strix]|uniref:Uncharacterized protein n=1 Tax=Streblomastix strix TaxID=222440 RepID=A0A5J4VUH3_9EUKA|nr:MAG: hypothetical protein EZS28_018370 [Streblomastix strix]
MLNDYLQRKLKLSKLEGGAAKQTPFSWLNSDKVKQYEDSQEKAVHLIHDWYVPRAYFLALQPEERGVLDRGTAALREGRDFRVFGRPPKLNIGEFKQIEMFVDAQNEQHNGVSGHLINSKAYQIYINI